MESTLEAVLWYWVLVENCHIWSVFGHRTLVGEHYIIGTNKRTTRVVGLVENIARIGVDG
jgi:hypothetical protein